MLRLSRLAACGLLLVASACNRESGGSGSEEASGASKPVSARLDDAATAIEAGEWSKALASLDAAIADSKATAEEKSLAWMDKVLCEAQANGDAAAIAALKKMGEAKVELSSDQFAKLGIDLANAEKTDASLEVVAIATEKFKGDKAVRRRLKKLAGMLNEKFAASGNTAGSEKLDSLGYLSSSTDDEEEDEEAPPAPKPNERDDG